MGDHIICNGLVNYFSLNSKIIYLPVNQKFKNQISYLYSENSKVKILPFDLSKVNDATAGVEQFAFKNSIPILKVGFESRVNKKTPFYKFFYKQLGLRYSVSYKYFSCPSDKDKESELYSYLIDKFNIKNEKYILVHDEASDEKYNLKINSNLKSVSLSSEFDIFNNIFFYRKIIMNAQEIHCVNSSFAHLIDRFDTNGKRIYHDIRGGRLKFKKKWSYIDYRH